MADAGEAGAGREAGPFRGWRNRIGIACVAALQLGALYVLFTTEYGPFAITLSLLAWLFANCVVLVLLPRPGIAAALCLLLTVVLVALSRFKFDILQLSLTFLDFLIIDRDTFSFLLSVFPRLKQPLLFAVITAVPVLWLIWRTDPFRIPRKISLALLAFATVAISASITSPTSLAPAWSRCRAFHRPAGSRPIRRRSRRCRWRAARTPPRRRYRRPWTATPRSSVRTSS
jgi:hypothetical protein